MRAVEKRVTAAGVTRYRVRFRYRGKETVETFGNADDAKRFAKWLDALGPQGALEQLYPTGGQDGDVPTLDQLAAAHIAHLTGITEGTRKRYTSLWDRTWARHLGHMTVNTITRDDVALAINVLAADYSRKSLENQRGLLSGVLGRAIDQGLLAKNPAKGLRLPRGKEGDAVEMRIITPTEWPAVEDRVTEHYKPFVRFLYGVGCRYGEAIALQVQDWQQPNIRIRRAVKWSPDGERVVGATKTKKSNRTVAVPRELHAELDAACVGKKRTDLIFTAARGGMLHHRSFWGRVWVPAVEHLTPRPRIHDLRHSHASILLAAGVPLHVVQARLGHESIQTTVDTYTHLMPDAQLAAASAASAAFTGAGGQRPDELLQAAYAAVDVLPAHQREQLVTALLTKQIEAAGTSKDLGQDVAVIVGELVEN